MRRNNLFWGAVILLVGVLLLLNSLNLLPGSFWTFFWPLLVILLGVWFLLSPAIDRGSREVKELSIPLEDASSAEVELHHGAGRIQLGSAVAPGMLLQGTFLEGVEHSIQRSGDRVRLALRPPHGMVFPFPPFGYTQGLRWDLNLARGIPMKLLIESGASETVADLTDLQVNELHVKTGASSTRLSLPAQAGYTRVHIEAGVAGVDVRIPQGVAARIRIDSGLSGINVDTNRFPRSPAGYETPGYDSATQRAEIYIQTGMGGIDVR